MTNETGGPAFPSKKRIYRAGYPTDEFEPIGGMAMRDYFAAKAMQGLLAADTDWTMPVETVAELAYDQADAMLEARK